MALKIDEAVEVRMPLKLVAALVVAIVSASYFVFHIEERIDIVDMKLEKLIMNFENYQAQPSRGHTEQQVMRTELEYLKEQIQELKGN
jgi:cell shape-determining protein MreC